MSAHQHAAEPLLRLLQDAIARFGLTARKPPAYAERELATLRHVIAMQKGKITVKLLVAGLLVSSLIAPCLSFGQQANEPLTRAQVREQIVELEKAGYTPGSFDPHYPEQIQGAQARIGMSTSGDNSQGTSSETPG